MFGRLISPALLLLLLLLLFVLPAVAEPSGQLPQPVQGESPESAQPELPDATDPSTPGDASPAEGDATSESAAAESATSERATAESVTPKTPLNYSTNDLAAVRILAISGAQLRSVDKKRKPGVKLVLPRGGFGTGVLLNGEGLILTAQHVIDDAHRVVVKIPGDDKVYPARVVYSNSTRDYAFVAIDGKQKHWTPMRKEVPRLSTRQPVYTIGYPLDVDRAYPQSARGIVAGILEDGTLQLDMSVNPGNSGGPLVDEAGGLLGIVVARRREESIAFAVTLERIKKTYGRLLKPGSKYHKARASLAQAKSPELREAELIGVLMENELAAGMFHEAMRGVYGADPGEVAKSITRVSAGKLTPTSRTLIAAHYWNSAIVYRTRNLEEYKKQANKARRHATRALKSAPRLKRRYKFLSDIEGLRVPRYKWKSKSTSAPPKKPMGYPWRASVGKARAICLSKKFEWTKLGERYVCSGAPRDLGIPTRTILTFCKGKLCQVDAFHQSDSESSKLWAHRAGGLRRLLSDYFGQPKKRDVRSPKRCARRLASCLKSGRARFDYSWEWRKSRRSLRLTVGVQKGTPTLRVRWTDTKLKK